MNLQVMSDRPAALEIFTHPSWTLVWALLAPMVSTAAVQTGAVAMPG
ncbi:hypothetical protein [Chromobacterium sphagni]|nr:hypothetical protein [Chromobacterium sphagni]